MFGSNPGNVTPIKGDLIVSGFSWADCSPVSNRNAYYDSLGTGNLIDAFPFGFGYKVPNEPNERWLELGGANVILKNAAATPTWTKGAVADWGVTASYQPTNSPMFTKDGLSAYILYTNAAGSSATMDLVKVTISDGTGVVKKFTLPDTVAVGDRLFASIQNIDEGSEEILISFLGETSDTYKTYTFIWASTTTTLVSNTTIWTPLVDDMIIMSADTTFYIAFIQISTTPSILTNRMMVFGEKGMFALDFNIGLISVADFGVFLEQSFITMSQTGTQKSLGGVTMSRPAFEQTIRDRIKSIYGVTL